MKFMFRNVLESRPSEYAGEPKTLKFRNCTFGRYVVKNSYRNHLRSGSKLLPMFCQRRM